MPPPRHPKTTAGCAFPQDERQVSLSAGDAALASLSMHSCVWPTLVEITTFANSILTLPVAKVATVVSIGAGSGVLEGLLQALGLTVVAVDLDVHSDPEDYETMPCYCDEIRRLPGDGRFLYEIEDPATTMLLFCYGRRCPLETYLQVYPTLAAVAIIGDLEHRAAAIVDDNDDDDDDVVAHGVGGGDADDDGDGSREASSAAPSLSPSPSPVSAVTSPTADALVPFPLRWTLVAKQAVRGALMAPDCMAYIYDTATTATPPATPPAAPAKPE